MHKTQVHFGELVLVCPWTNMPAVEVVVQVLSAYTTGNPGDNLVVEAQETLHASAVETGTLERTHVTAQKLNHHCSE